MTWVSACTTCGGYDKHFSNCPDILREVGQMSDSRRPGEEHYEVEPSMGDRRRWCKCGAAWPCLREKEQGDVCSNPYVQGEAVAEPSREPWPTNERRVLICPWCPSKPWISRCPHSPFTLKQRILALEQEIAACKRGKEVAIQLGLAAQKREEAAEARVAELEKERDIEERRARTMYDANGALVGQLEKAEKEASDLREERDELQRRDLLQLRNKKVLEANEQLRAALRDMLGFTDKDSLSDQQVDARLREDFAAARERAEALLSAGEHETQR